MHKIDVEHEDSEFEYVAPSTTNNLFANKDVSVVLKLCRQVIACGPILEIRIHDELNRTSAGHNLFSWSKMQLKS